MGSFLSPPWGAERRSTFLTPPFVLDTRLCLPARLRACACARSRFMRPGEGAESSLFPRILARVAAVTGASQNPGGGDCVARTRGDDAAVDAVESGTRFEVLCLEALDDPSHSPVWRRGGSWEWTVGQAELTGLHDIGTIGLSNPATDSKAFTA